jgi:hypothetical protein
MRFDFFTVFGNYLEQTEATYSQQTNLEQLKHGLRNQKFRLWLSFRYVFS